MAGTGYVVPGKTPKAGVVTPVPDGSGATVSFQGSFLPWVTSIEVDHGQAQEYQILTINAGVRGSGNAAVPLSRVMVGLVKPGSVRITGLGHWYDDGDIGKYGVLHIVHAVGLGVMKNAFLKECNRTVETNGVFKVSAVFQFTD